VLTWDAVEEAKEYAVYRDEKRIAVVTTNEYTDGAVGDGKEYAYQVSAVNDKCVESDLSNILTVETPEGDEIEKPTQDAKLSCEKPVITKALPAGETSIPIALIQGENLITFIVIDKAGH